MELNVIIYIKEKKTPSSCVESIQNENLMEL